MDQQELYVRIFTKQPRKQGIHVVLLMVEEMHLKDLNTIKIGNQLDIYLHVLKARLFDASGFGSKKSYQFFVKQIKGI